MNSTNNNVALAYALSNSLITCFGCENLPKSEIPPWRYSLSEVLPFDWWHHFYLSTDRGERSSSQFRGDMWSSFESSVVLAS